MRLPPGSSVTGATAAGEVNRTKPAAPSAGGAEPADGIRISSGFETLSILNANQAVKVARVAAEVRSGSYRVNSAAVGKAIVDQALVGAGV